jgi:hypothetical protein
LAAENGYYDILVSLLHSKYNDITKTYLNTTSLEIADFPKLAEKLSVIRTDMKILSKSKNILPVRRKTPKKFTVMCIMLCLALLECFTIVLAMGHLISPLVFI